MLIPKNSNIEIPLPKERKIQKTLEEWVEAVKMRVSRWVFRIIGILFFSYFSSAFYHFWLLFPIFIVVYFVFSWTYDFVKYLKKLNKLRNVSEDPKLEQVYHCEIYTFELRLFGSLLVIIYFIVFSKLGFTNFFIFVLFGIILCIHIIGCYSLRYLQAFFASFLMPRVIEEDYKKTLKIFDTMIILRVLFLVPYLNFFALIRYSDSIGSLHWRFKVFSKYQLSMTQEFSDHMPPSEPANKRIFNPQKPFSLQCTGCDHKCALYAESFCQLLKPKSEETPAPSVTRLRIDVSKTEPMYCGNCGSTINITNERFCRNCGNPTQS